jgi:hypothetical protein
MTSGADVGYQANAGIDTALQGDSMTAASRVLGTLTIAAVLCSAVASAVEPGPPRAARPTGAEAWGATRWGMSPDEVVAALRGEAFRVTPEVKLADGNVVAVGIDGHNFEGLKVNVRFVFQEGKLALVSLRTPQNQHAEATVFESVRRALVERWGQPLETTSDDNFIDLRQTRWDQGARRVDLKYIPGVVAVVFYPAPARSPSPEPGKGGP